MPNASPLKKRLWLLGRVALVVGLLWWVVASNGRERIFNALLSAHLGYLALGVVIFFISIVLGAFQWHLLLRWQGIRMGFHSTFRTYYVGLFLNNFLPGTVGGDVVRVVEVKRASEGWGKAAAATLLDRLFGFAALSLLALMALLFERMRGVLTLHVFVHLLKAVSLVAICFAVALVFLLSRRTSAFFHAAVRLTPWRKLDDAFSKLQDLVDAYRHQWPRMGVVFSLAMVVQILRVAVHWSAGLALGLHIAPAFYFCFIPIIAIAGVVPINVGGWGIPQSLGTYLYSLPGILPLGLSDPEASAAALAFLPSVLGLVVMLGGGIYLVIGRKPQGIPAATSP
jgi:glycosyltransferase 2 family protein